MDQPESARSEPDTSTVQAEAGRSAAAPAVAAPGDGPTRVRHFDPQPAHHAPRLPGLLAFGAILFGFAAFAFSGWIYSRGQEEIMRLSTELAELRVSLDLYIRNGGGSGETLADLQARLATLENASASATVPLPAATTTATPQATAESGDCLPAGMRLLVAAGDTYPICGQSAAVNVSFVDNGYITLADGTSVASGGTMPLPGSACMIAVTSGGDEGLTGYAEIRVSC